MLTSVLSNAVDSPDRVSEEIGLLDVENLMGRQPPALGEDEEEIFAEMLKEEGLSDAVASTSTRHRRASTTVSVSSGDEQEDQDNRVSSFRRSSRVKDTTHSRRTRAKTGLTTSKGFKRHFAVHDYHDYSHVTASEMDNEPRKGNGKNGVSSNFPVLLHRMMEDAEPMHFATIISWQPHGRAFLIHDPIAFVERVLPNYFKHSKLSSFQRQLSLYGFVRLTGDGDDRGAYYHECFLRYRPFLCSKIRRKRVKGTWIRTSSSPESEPKFHLMEPVQPLESLTSSSSLPIFEESEPNIIQDLLPEQHMADEAGPTETRRPSPVEIFLSRSVKAAAPNPLPPPPGLPKETLMRPKRASCPSNPCHAPFLGARAFDMDSILADLDMDIDFDADLIFPL